MMQGNISSEKAKISPQFEARLGRLNSEEKVRAIVLLRPSSGAATFVRGKGRSNRRTLIQAMRQATESFLSDLDEILDRFNGKRLAASVDALGSIPVETTVAGINALAESKHVKAILEDQPIMLPKQRRA